MEVSKIEREQIREKNVHYMLEVIDTYLVLKTYLHNFIIIHSIACLRSHNSNLFEYIYNMLNLRIINAYVI